MRIKFRFRTLKKELILSFLFLTLTISICIGGVSFFITHKLIKERLTASYISTLDYIANSVNIELGRIENLTNFIFVNDSLKKAIMKNDENSLESITVNYQAYTDIKQYFLSHSISDVNSIAIAGFNDFFLYYYSNLDERENVYLPNKLKEWSNEFKESKGNLIWKGLQKRFLGADIINTKEIRLFRVIKNENYKENIGFMFISLKPRSFSKFIDLYGTHYPNFAKESLIFITNGDDFLLAPENPIITDSEVSKIVHSSLSYSMNGYNLKPLDRIAFTRPIADTDWKIVGIIPQEYIRVGNNYIIFISLFAILLSVLSCTLLWYYFSEVIFKPLKKLSDTIKKIESGSTNLRVDVFAENEIGTLSRNFNRMLDQNEILFKQNLNRELKVKEAQFEALQSQMNPHFLYNTLNTIRWMAIINKADNIKNVIDSFWKIIKYSHQSTDAFTSINKEMEIISEYLNLQKIAYKNCFKILWDLDEKLLSYKCIKFILQPLVENSIKHGILSSKKNNGIIRITLKEQKNNILLSIYDNGAGIDNIKLSHINTIINNKNSNNEKKHGLINIIYRLWYIYGNDCIISIDSKQDHYTLVKIVFPKERYI